MLLLKHLLCLFPIRREKYYKQAVGVTGEMRHFTLVVEDAAQLVSATVATLSWYISGRGRTVVDIVLLLQQQHNNKIFTSFLTRRTWRRVVANFWKFLLLLPFVLSTFFLSLLFCVHCTCVNTHFDVKDRLHKAGENTEEKK